MSSIERKTFDNPEETRKISNGAIDVIRLGDLTAMRLRFEPGWRWSESMKPIVGTESCQVNHLLHVLSGKMAVRMDDGTETELGPGDVCVIPSGHDAWIVGDQEFVGIDLQGVTGHS